MLQNLFILKGLAGPFCKYLQIICILSIYPKVFILMYW